MTEQPEEGGYVLALRSSRRARRAGPRIAYTAPNARAMAERDHSSTSASDGSGVTRAECCSKAVSPTAAIATSCACSGALS